MHVKQAKKYLEQRGRSCPLCGSSDIEGGAMDFESGEITQRISCHECNERWSDYRVDLHSSRVTSASNSPRLSIFPPI
jgi:formate dehydrogenase maturation protein FdhE